MYDRPIKYALHNALDTYLYAMRPFMIRRLRQVRGRQLEATIRGGLNGSQLGSFDLSLSKGRSVEDSVDIGHFFSLVTRYWNEVFCDAFDGDRVVQGRLANICQTRNALAHPTQQEISEDFDLGDAKKCLSEIADILGRINRPDERTWVESIRSRLLCPASPALAATQTTGGQIGNDSPEAAPSPVESPAAYWVYEDGPTNRTRIHLATCRFCNNGLGLHGSRLPDNRWIGPLESATVALEVALDTERRDIAECKICRPLQ